MIINLKKFYQKNYNLIVTLVTGFKCLLTVLYEVIKAYRNNNININLINFNKAIIETLKNLHKNQYYNYIDFITAILYSILYITGIKKTSLLKSGNLKIDKNIKIFDLPSIITCKYACQNCYAIKSERIYQNTRVMRLYHLILLNYAFLDVKFYNTLIDDFKKELEHVNIMRWHGSGDIYCNKYLFFILKIVTDNKHVNFYTYSKILDNNSIDFINNNFKNFNIIKSLINDKYVNYGDDKYIKKVTNILKKDKKDYFVCSYNENNKKEHGTCMNNCKECLKNSNILFHVH